MAQTIQGTRIADLDDGEIPSSLDRIPVERSPYGKGTNRRITPRDLVGLKIAVLGDSLSGKAPLLDKTWPRMIEDNLNSLGDRVQVKSFSIWGHTFFRANTQQDYTSTDGDAQTAVEAVNAWKPDVVIVPLGGNDVTGADSRTLTQIKSDAETLFSALRAGNPGVVLVLMRATIHDEANFADTGDLVNKGVVPFLMTLKSAGILTDLYTSEMLDDAVSSTNIGVVDDLYELFDHIEANADIDGTVTIDLFKIMRLGAAQTDVKHLTPFGLSMVATYVLSGLQAIAEFTAIVPAVPTTTYDDADALFADCLTDSGNGYLDNTPALNFGELVNANWGYSGRVINTENWFMPYKGSLRLDTAALFDAPNDAGVLHWTAFDCAPLSVVQYSINGAAFANAGGTTDSKGNARGKLAVGLLNIANGTLSFLFKVGTSVFGPFSVTKSATVFGNVNTTAVGNVGTGEDDLMTFTIPAGFALPNAGRAVRVVQRAVWANNANAKQWRSYFGGSLIASTGALATSIVGDLRLEYTVTSTGSNTQMYQGLFTLEVSAGTYITAPFGGTLTIDDDAAIIVKSTGEAVSNNDVQQTYQRVYYE